MTWILISSLWFTLALGCYLLLKSRYAALVELEPSSHALENPPTLAVIIPTRDEAENIAACLKGLSQQTYPSTRLEVVVVDDGSSDGTVQIARTFMQSFKNLKLREAGPLPHGWLGKPHACWVGASGLEAEWVCFVDADTHHAPGLLLSAVRGAQQGQIDLLSLHPNQEMLGFWERLLMPIPFMTLMILMNAQRINDPAFPTAMANGQFILIKRTVYDAIDGHRAIRNQVMDDIALARMVKSHGYSLKLFGGARLIHTRMYTTLKSLWQGLARGGSELFGVPLTSLAVISSLVTAFLPLAYPLWQVSRASGSINALPLLSAGIGLLGSIVWYAAHALALHTYRVPYRYLLLLPISNLLIALANADGLFRRMRGKRLWKGRPI